MQVVVHRSFEKLFLKLSKSIQEQTIQRLELFSKDLFNMLLHNHSLKGD